MRILAIGAHPDDIEFGVGGLVIKESQKGSTLKYAVCSLGEAGSGGTPEGRKAEAEAGAKIAGAEIEFLNFGGDSHFEDKPQNAFELARVIREFKPNIILAPSQTLNQHPDHVTVSKLARDACRYARYGGLKELKDFPIHKVDALYYYPSSAEWDKKPDLIIDVSDVHDKWEQAMQAHTSQMKTRDYLNLVNSKSSYTGSQVGVKYAIGLWANDPIRVDYLSDFGLSSRNY